jgi:LysM repeat protein
MHRTKIGYCIVVLAGLWIGFNVLTVAAQDTAEPAGTTYEVREADETLVGVAERFEIPLECLVQANDLTAASDLEAGQTLFIPDDCDALPDAGGGDVEATDETTESISPAALTQDTTYTVVAGDRLADIAQAYSVTVNCLVRANRIANPNLIYVGQQIFVPVSCAGGGGGDTSSGGGASSLDLMCQFDRYAGRNAPNGVYTVRQGDTLDYIACDFGISLTCLLNSNPEIVNHKRLAVGDQLVINTSCPAWDGAVIP